MKRIMILFALLLASSIVFVGFSPIAEQAENDDKPQVDLEKGTEVVIFKVQKLYGKVRSSPKETDEINKIGTSIAENWDIIEKQVEAKYPKDYENIEKSLYPLIANTQSDSPDIERMKSLITEVTKKLNNFKEKISKD